MKTPTKCLLVVVLVVLLGADPFISPRTVLAAPPKLEIGNTAVIVVSSILLVATVTTAIITKDMWQEEKEEERERKKKAKKKEYTVKNKDQMKIELKAMQRGDWVPTSEDDYTPGPDYPEDYDTDTGTDTYDTDTESPPEEPGYE